MHFYKRSGFTLVELIVGISIITILATIGFISFTGYTQNSRDTVRKTDIGNIEKVLQLYYTKSRNFPDPTNSFEVVYSWYPLWIQGEFGQQTQVQTGKIFWELEDPKYGNKYSYSTTQSQQEYQLWVVYERTEIGSDDWRFTHNIIPQTQAAGSENTIVNLFDDDPSMTVGLKAWYDAEDADNDWTPDYNDTSIENVWIVTDVSETDFTPFYFDRVIWLDAQDIRGNATSYTDGADVTTWRNKTGWWFDWIVPLTANNHSNPAFSSAPNYFETWFDWNPGVFFNGQSKWDRIVVNRWTQPKGSSFSLAYTFSVNDTVNTNHATIISVWPTSWGQYYSQAWWWQLSRDGTNNQFVFRIAGNIVDRVYYNIDGTIDTRNDNVICSTCSSGWNDAEVAFGTWDEVNDNTPHTVFVTYDSNVVTGYLDGTKRFEVTYSESTQPFWEYFRFFGNRAGTAYLEWYLWEVFIAGEKISLQDIEKIEWYFANRWNWVDELPTDHPYKTNPPLMDPVSQLDYTRFSWLDSIPNSFDSEAFYSSNPSVLNTNTVRYPWSMPGINISEVDKLHIWRGPIKVSQTWNYTFSLEVNDYGFIKIDGSTVVDAGLNNTGLQIWSINLTAGTLYDFEMIYGMDQATWGQNGSVEYRVDGPGVVWYRKYAAFGWIDKTSNNNNLGQLIPENQPSYNVATQSFDFMEDDYFNFDVDPYSISDDIEVFVVWDIDDDAISRDLDGYILENTIGWSWSLTLGAGGLQVWSEKIESTTILWKQTQLSSYKITRTWNTNLSYFLGGQNYEISSAAISDFDLPFYLWGKEVGFNGSVKEVLMYDRLIALSDREKIEWYLSHKWGIAHKLPWLHPYYEALDSDDQSYIELSGNYNGIFVHSKLGESHIVVATPSITSSLASTNTSIDITTLIGENRLVFNGYRNVPASYSSGVESSEKLVTENGFFFDVGEPKIFDGSKFELANYRGISDIDSKIRSIYGNSRTYKHITSYLEANNSNYVKDILSDVVWINPITPYYCKDILERGIWSNIAYLANIIWSSGEQVSGWIETLIDWETSIDEDFTYKTTPSEDTEIEFVWNDAYEVNLIRIYNSFGDVSQNLWLGSMKLFDENDIEIYEYTFWDTLWLWVIEVNIPEAVSIQWIQRMTLTPTPDYDDIALREIQVFAGEILKSGIYKVDSDGAGWIWSYNVYCDMETEWGGWTKVGENFIDKWNFQWQTHSSRFTWFLTSGDKNIAAENNILAISTPSVINNGNVLRHSGDENAYYELFFDDLPDVEFSSELRLGAWVRGSSLSVMNYELEYIDKLALSFHNNPFVSNPNTWRYETIRIPLTDTVESFTWNIGLGVDASSTPFDITGVSLELYYK